jgi:hypothetical protein
VAFGVPSLVRFSLSHLDGVSNFMGKHSDAAIMRDPYSAIRATPVSMSTSNSQSMRDLVVIFQMLKDLFDLIIT